MYNIPVRPIVSSVGSVTNDMVKFLTFVLRPLVGNTKHNDHNSFDFLKKIKGITMKPEETIISYDVEGLFTSMPPSSAIDAVHKHYLKMLHSVIELICLVIRHVICRICAWIAYISVTMVSFINNVIAVKGSQVSPIVSSLYAEQFEHLALSTYLYTRLQSWY